MYINTLPAAFPAAIRAAGSHPGLAYYKKLPPVSAELLHYSNEDHYTYISNYTETALPIVSAVFMGQSELVHFLSTAAYYRQIAQPVPGDGNLTIISEGVTTTVNQASVDAGYVNPAMAAMSSFLSYVKPNYKFIVGNVSVGGTSRRQLMDDEQLERSFSSLSSIVDTVETLSGNTLNVLVEAWYNSDAAFISDFKNAFWPFYFGVTGDGDTFTLGDPHSVIASDVDHCLWDADASVGEKGRGILSKGSTKWDVITPMPFYDSPVAPADELEYFAWQRLAEPCRMRVRDLIHDEHSRANNLHVGPSSHLCRFGGTSTEAHPDVGSEDGIVMFMWPFAISLLRHAGLIIKEPIILGLTGATDGSYADIIVSLPNGGTLTTLREFRVEAAPDIEPPHYQDVVGFEITRNTVRHPVYKESETSYNVDYRGTIAIIDSGSGTQRTGTVRITPETPFTNDVGLSYLRGQATGVLLEDRDLTAHLYANFLLEHIPSLYDSEALYPFPGVAVRPYQETLAVDFVR